MSEFQLIGEIAQRIKPRPDVLLGIGDDCAILMPPKGKSLALSTDTLVSGVHFFPSTEPYLIGFKALAVNLSDLAAMGAQPLWYALNLTLPDSDPAFARELTRGMHTLAVEHGLSLVGGDTTQGPLAITITVIGSLVVGTGLRRSGAQIGDGIYVSGTLGDAAGALQLRLNRQEEPAWLAQRLDQPTPRIALGLALQNIASSAIDVSDGLRADLGHICAQSRCSAVLYAERLPLSHELVQSHSRQEVLEFALSGGDDYELCFSAHESYENALAKLSADLAVRITRIGTIGKVDPQFDSIQVFDEHGALIETAKNGYQHFAMK